MISISFIKKFIKSLDPQKNVHRFTFYNFLCHFCSEQQKLNDDVLFDFFNHVYQIEHWQKNQTQLLEHTQDLVERFYRHSHNFNSTVEIKNKFAWQLIKIEKKHDFNLAVNHFLKRICDEQDRIKVVSLNEDECLCLIVGSDDSIQVRVYNRNFKIVNGIISPTAPATQLFYNSKLELMPNTRQVLSLDKHTQAHIYPTKNGGGVGYLMRGYSLQKHSRFEYDHFSQYPDMYQQFKQLEHHFIQAKSDPDYVSLVSLVEKSTQMLLSAEPGSEKLAVSTLEKIQFACMHHFPNDKYLKLLLSQLELAMVKTRSPIEAKFEL